MDRPETLWLADPWLTGIVLTKQADGCRSDTLIDYRCALAHLHQWLIQARQTAPR